jgi:hypothetical protein
LAIAAKGRDVDPGTATVVAAAISSTIGAASAVAVAVIMTRAKSNSLAPPSIGAPNIDTKTSINTKVQKQDGQTIEAATPHPARPLLRKIVLNLALLTYVMAVLTAILGVLIWLSDLPDSRMGTKEIEIDSEFSN